uniref:Trichohyalin-plectin-homology domain-containing protein n=1 Tax=Pyramimonas obovata TaxID=1411642 RepID=A0A7S0N4K9_9CHLO
MKTILKEKLAQRDGDEGTKRGLYSAILLVERFLKYAKGTDAELAVLKEQVQRLLKTNGKGAPKAQVPSRPHSTRPCVRSAEPCSTPAKGSPKPADGSHRVQRVAQIADLGQLCYTLPPLTVERKGRTKMGDFALLNKGLAEVSRRQIQEEYNTKKRNQQRVRTDLSGQIREMEEQRVANMRAKQEALKDMDRKIHEHQDELEEQHRQWLEECKKKKGDRDRAVMDANARKQVQKELAWAQELAIVKNAKAELRAQQEKEHRIFLENKTELVETAKLNSKRIKEKFLEREEEKKHDAALSKQAMQMAIDRENSAKAAVEKIAEKGRQMLKMGGMDELVAAREKKFREELERAQRDKEAYEREQDRIAAEREAARKQREHDTVLTLDKQMRELRARKQKEKDELTAFGRGLARDVENYSVLENELEQARRLMNEDNKLQVVEQWQTEAQRRYADQVGVMSEFETARNKEYLQIALGKA